MLAGVCNNSKIGLTTIAETTIIIKTAIAVNVIQFPMVTDNSFLCFAPKYWATIILAPILIPTNKTNNKFKIGVALPTAARALSPTYFPTTILSTVL